MTRCIIFTSAIGITCQSSPALLRAPRLQRNATQLRPSLYNITFPSFPVPSIPAMSVYRHPQGDPVLESYHDDPTMTSPGYDDGRSPPIQSPTVLSPTFLRDLAADPARPPLLSIRSSVPLLPTPGSVSKRHPTKVRCPFRLDSRVLIL